MSLRYYQQDAVDAFIDYTRHNLEPALIKAPPGAGKSHIIASIADIVHKMSGKKILVLAPSKELVEQDREKYMQTGNPSSIFSASLARKCTKHPVVFGTPKTVKNSIGRFNEEIALVVIDECHKATDMIQNIIEVLRERNPNLRVLGLTATPYVMGKGYIYDIDDKGQKVPEEACINPYFKKCVIDIDINKLTSEGYLTPILRGDIDAESYDVSRLKPNRLNSRSEVNKAFIGHGRKTASIVADVVHKTKDYRGVMFFAATVAHAREIKASLPSGNCDVITDKTTRITRERIIRLFKAQKIKYLVNVQVLTTGFDATHCDCIALLRFTDSVALLEQMLGRGIRLHENKPHCLVLDYSESIDKHYPDGELFNPSITARSGTSSGTIDVTCPTCNNQNNFSVRPNNDKLEIDEEGYFLDLEGNRIMLPEGPMTAHHGRRCRAVRHLGEDWIQCGHRWTHKDCPECDTDNDISSRYCRECRHELVDPNEKLIGEFKSFKRDPYNVHTDKVISVDFHNAVTLKGVERLKATFKTERRSVTIWYNTDAIRASDRAKYERLLAAVGHDYSTPLKTITYFKNKSTKFFTVVDYNQPEDTKENFK